MDAYETSLFTAVLYIVIVLGCIIGYFGLSALWQQRKRLALQRSYLRNELNLQEKDRSRIGRDLHDEIGPLLWFAQAQLEVLKAEAPALEEGLEKSNVHLKKALELMGRIVADITPGKVLDKGLGFAIHDLFTELPLLFDIRFHLDCHIHSTIEKERAIQVYRIIQEVIRNALKHAEAKELRLVVNERKKILYIECTDDGKGFNPELKASKGLGLMSIANRVELLGGSKECESRPGKGTRYFFSLPI